MTIISLSFTGFLLAVLVVYYLVPRRLQNIWLLLSSYVFYAILDLRFALLFLLLTAASYRIGLALGAGRNRASWLWLGIGLNVLTLLFFKLVHFFMPGLAVLLERAETGSLQGSLALILPVGLSFRILENISYLVDVSRKQIQPSRSPVDFALYLVYFPKMVAGPIERAGTFLPRLAAARVVDNQVLARSFALIIVGLFRKLVVADSLRASITTQVLTDPGMFPAPELLFWLVVFAFSLYNDFAGYTSIVRGVSGLFGIELSPNFNLPYFARSLNEFWNRWHITLSHWLRDYIFFPLRRLLIKQASGRIAWLGLVLPPLVTMLASGFWHGTGWNMLVWGGLHGVYLVGEQLYRQKRPGNPATQPAWQQALSMTVIFGLVCMAWVPFMLSLSTALAYWRGLLNLESYKLLVISPGLFARQFYILLFLIPVVGLDWLQQRYQDEVFFLRWPRPAQAILLAVAFFLFFIVTLDSGPLFVYRGF